MECKDCYWFYHIPECFAEIEINGEYMCTNRDVKTLKIEPDKPACSQIREINDLYLGRTI